MKFLIDAQLPRKLAKTISDAGYRAIHTLLLPNANKTTDAELINFLLPRTGLLSRKIQTS